MLLIWTCVYQRKLWDVVTPECPVCCYSVGRLWGGRGGQTEAWWVSPAGTADIRERGPLVCSDPWLYLMDYTEMPKPAQPEVDSHRHCSVCRLVTNSSSVLVSLSHVVDLRSINRHWVLHASMCDEAFTFSSSNVIWPCWPQCREAGRVPDFAPFSPSLCPLFKRPAPTQTQYHHCGLLAAGEHSEVLATHVWRWKCT